MRPASAAGLSLTMRHWLGHEREPSDHERLVASAMAFAAACFQQASRDPGNVCIAPAGLFSLLALAQAGARGATALEMARALRLPPLTPSRFHAAASGVRAALHDAPGVELTIGQGLFVQRGRRLQPDFVRLLNDHYGGAHDGFGHEGGLLHDVDFRGSTEEARDAINAWIERDTGWRITNLVPRGAVGVRTRLMLVHALDVSGAWASAFHEGGTRARPFLRADGRSTTVPLMSRRGTYRMIEWDDPGSQGSGQVIELPYRDEAVAMIVLLPSRANGLRGVEDALASRLGDWLWRLDETRPRAVEVYLPRFQVRSPLRLDAALTALGMVRAFEAGRADFSGLAGPPADLFLTGVLHHASVEVSERGAAPAAATSSQGSGRVLELPYRDEAIATGLAMAPTGVGAILPPMPIFRADRPFLFALRDTRTKSIILLGRVADPTSDR